MIPKNYIIIAWKWRWRGQEERRMLQRCPLYATWLQVDTVAQVGTGLVWEYATVGMYARLTGHLYRPARAPLS